MKGGMEIEVSKGSILVFDTETTGKADFKLPVTHPSQPRIVQFAFQLYDENWNVRAEGNYIIKPDGYEIPQEASNIHGITTAMANRYGVPIKPVLEVFGNLLAVADGTVGHNVSFDEFMTDIECSRNGRGKFKFVSFCTMHAMTQHCKLPGSYGDYKWPKLQEAYQHCYGCSFEGAHDAMADLEACAKVYRWLLLSGNLKPS